MMFMWTPASSVVFIQPQGHGRPLWVSCFPSYSFYGPTLSKTRPFRRNTNARDNTQFWEERRRLSKVCVRKEWYRTQSMIPTRVYRYTINPHDRINPMVYG